MSAASGRHGGWVRGSTVTAADELALHLREVAQHHARRALRDYGSTDDFALLDAAASAGTAVELIAKACIATVEPAALARGTREGPSSVGHLLRLRGHAIQIAETDSRPVTLDAAVALKVSVRMFPSMGSHEAGAKLALDVRNGALHLGLVDSDELRAAVAAMVEFLTAALPVLDSTAESFWGEARGAADASELVRVREQELAQVVTLKIAEARGRWERMLVQLGEEQARGAAGRGLRALEAREGSPGFIHRCPACQNFGWATLDADVDVEPDGDGGYSYSISFEWIDGFNCPTCGLDLDFDEVEHADIRRPTAADDFSGDRD